MATIGSKPDTQQQRAEVRAEILRLLEAEPLVGVTTAAQLVGIKAPNFWRDAAPHLTPVTVQGSATVYFRSEVAEFAKERKRRRAKGNGR